MKQILNRKILTLLLVSLLCTGEVWGGFIAIFAEMGIDEAVEAGGAAADTAATTGSEVGAEEGGTEAAQTIGEFMQGTAVEDSEVASQLFEEAYPGVTSMEQLLTKSRSILRDLFPDQPVMRNVILDAIKRSRGNWFISGNQFIRASQGFVKESQFSFSSILRAASDNGALRVILDDANIVPMAIPSGGATQDPQPLLMLLTTYLPMLMLFTLSLLILLLHPFQDTLDLISMGNMREIFQDMSLHAQ